MTPAFLLIFAAAAVISAVALGLYLLICRAIKSSRTQYLFDNFFIALLGVISVSAVIVWRLTEDAAALDSPADGKTKAAVILLFAALWLAFEAVLILIQLKKDGKTLKEYLHERFSFIKKKDAPKKEIKHKRKK